MDEAIELCKQMIIDKFKKCNENIVIITIKHLQINQILALNNPQRVDMPLNK